MKNNSKQITVKFETGTAVLENRLRRLKTKLDQVKALIDEINSKMKKLLSSIRAWPFSL